MAFRIDYGTNKWGVDLSAAYVRFRKNPRVDYGAGTAILRWEVFVSEAAKDAGKAPLPGIGFATPAVEVSFDGTTDTPDGIVGAAYASVPADAEAFPEFVGAVNV